MEGRIREKKREEEGRRRENKRRRVRGRRGERWKIRDVEEEEREGASKWREVGEGWKEREEGEGGEAKSNLHGVSQLLGDIGNLLLAQSLDVLGPNSIRRLPLRLELL
jgi:hypothetical protein